ncbi:MAG TPA: hypothetical protein VNV83_01730 [Acidimicrobiales bacterium]|jgi:hypothetical protein|nr:hypothetical protein [Acidimicrobiales bacterium]
MTTSLARAARWLGRFLWDFLVGDTPELALATGALVAIAFILAGSEWLGAVLLPLLAAGFLLASTWRGRKRAPSGSTRP